MAVDKPLTTSPVLSDLPKNQEVSVEISPAIDTEETEDGVVILLDGEFSEDVAEEIDHDSNLAEYIEDTELEAMASDLVQSVDGDKRSRTLWAEAFVKGMDQLGMKIEERQEPWPGAAGMFHPLLTEAVVRFQAHAMAELFPETGPASSKILGKFTPEKLEQSKRVQNELNYQLTEEMSEYRDEMEHMLLRAPLAGSAFKKVYYDPIRERPVAMFVPAEDFIVSYGASDLQTCDRYTHVMKKSANEVFRLQLSGFYRDVDLPEPVADLSDIQQKYDELQGTEHSIDDDDRHTLLEVHVTMNMPEDVDDPEGIPRPYVVTIDSTSRTVLSIYRNWDEEDPKAKKREHFVHYRYLPGLGFYGIGLIHLIGGLAKSATSIMRQLIDAGTLSNLPAGLKARGMRIKGDDAPLRPGEFRDVDVPGGTIRDAITFLPYKEPSAVLYSLLGTVVDEGRRIGSIADADVGDMGAQTPVGTMLAIMERSLKVTSGVQARMHASLKKELRLISRIIHDYMPPQYAYDPEGDWDRVEDFDGRVDIIPVSDPNASTMAQRVMQYQAALQMAQGAPQLYDLGKLHRQMLEILNIQGAEDIVKLPKDLKPKDPVAENMAILKQEPVKAFQYQDHEAHIQVHMAAAQDPKIMQIVGQSPFASVIQSAMASHITEHIAMQYRMSIQKQLGAELPDEDEALPEDVEQEVSRLAAQAADKLLKKNKIEEAAKAAEKAAKDPLTMIQKKELELKEREVKLKEDIAKHNAAKDVIQAQRDDTQDKVKAEAEQERIASQERMSGGKLAVDIAKAGDQIASTERLKGAELGVKIAESLDNSAQKEKTDNGPDGTS